MEKKTNLIVATRRDLAKLYLDKFTSLFDLNPNEWQIANIDDRYLLQGKLYDRIIIIEPTFEFLRNSVEQALRYFDIKEMCYNRLVKGGRLEFLP